MLQEFLSTDPDHFNIYNTCDEADFYLLAAPSMKELLGQYTRVTGGNYVLPKWAYGLCFGPNMREIMIAMIEAAFIRLPVQ